MNRNQIEKFAVGYPYPTDVVEDILKKSDFDKNKAHEILCGDRKKVEDIWQNIINIVAPPVGEDSNEVL